VLLEELVRRGLEEDVGQGDVTTLAVVPPELEANAEIIAKQDLIVCGHACAGEVFRQLGIAYVPVLSDGSRVKPGDVVARVKGKARGMLTGERLALNFLMKLSGIATHTRSIVDGCTSGMRVVDTRKTTPLLRAQERGAVRVGGGSNHRFALYDGVLIKDNHIQAAGSVKEAIQRAKSAVHHLLKIEVEVEDIAGLEEAIESGADVVMLDNMSNEELEKAIALCGGRVTIEASGNMDARRIAEIQHMGIDVVSMGGLIHQATWADLSMKFR
jgi:nicotinate-nucleotide pyrophosphorylase (carboxylating)